MMTNYPYPDQPGYFHLLSDGELTPNFICDEEHDFPVAFNLIGVCAANTDVTILSYSIENTHLHILAYGTKENCVRFKIMYEESWAHHIGRVRGTRKKAAIEIEILRVDTEEYLLNVGTYTITQPTKDGKQVMPYDYRWGTGSLYFRSKDHRSLWCRDISGRPIPTVLAGDMSERARRVLLCSYHPIPPHWILCNGILLPENYVDIDHFEQIYRTANRYRVFLASNSNRDQFVQAKIAMARGIRLDDAEAREKCRAITQELFGVKDIRRLNALQRITVAQRLRKVWHLNARQIASVVRLPYSEVCKYI